jgi:tetratricopeptide (TPR) repeat protein
MVRPSLIAGFVLALALPLSAQDNSSQQQQDNSTQQQNPPAQPGTQQKKDQPKKSPAQENPFPEAQSEAAAQKSQQQDSGSAPDAPPPQSAPGTTQPNASSSGNSQNKTADQNPFPEAQSQKAAHQSDPQNATPPPDSGDSSYSSSQVKGLNMPTTDEQAPANLPPSPLPYDPKLARKDSSIGDFYMESGNWHGAYDRFLEANRSDPGNAEAVFGLAESARHLGHNDEALRNYRLYLSALPRGPHAKEVHKALKDMGADQP